MNTKDLIQEYTEKHDRKLQELGLWSNKYGVVIHYALLEAQERSRSPQAKDLFAKAVREYLDITALPKGAK